MIPTQTFEDYPIFGSNATKIEPGDAKKSAGFQQADVLPYEWMNWAWNKNSKGISDLNDGATSIEAEINNVLSEAGITPNASNNNQLYKSVRKINGYINTTTTTITGAPSIEAGDVINIRFAADILGNDDTTGLLISYNGSGKPVYVCKNGSLVELTAYEITSGIFKYIQENTILSFVYDGTNLIIAGNPVILSNADYTIYADGTKRVNSITNGEMGMPTSNAVYNKYKTIDITNDVTINNGTAKVIRCGNVVELYGNLPSGTAGGVTVISGLPRAKSSDTNTAIPIFATLEGAGIGSAYYRGDSSRILVNRNATFAVNYHTTYICED